MHHAGFRFVRPNRQDFARFVRHRQLLVAWVFTENVNHFDLDNRRIDCADRRIPPTGYTNDDCR